MGKVKNNGPKIIINPKAKGSFTRYCKQHGYNGVTKACVEEGLKSPNPKTRKRANFARNFALKHTK